MTQPDEFYCVETERTIAISRETQAKLTALMGQIDECIDVLQREIELARKRKGATAP
jgi:hypothetical protein